MAPRHYPLIVALHTCWILTLMVFRYDQPIHIGWLLIFGLIQMFRVWVLATLGRRWTTRIIVTDEPLVARGPYRWLTHPNYILVVCEIAVAPLVLGLWWVTVVFTVLNAVVLNIRIRAENDALAAKRSA